MKVGKELAIEKAGAAKRAATKIRSALIGATKLRSALIGATKFGMRDSRSESPRSSRRKREGLFAMDGVQRILVLSFTARTRNASRGREVPEEWASLLLFFVMLVAGFAVPAGANAMSTDTPAAHRLPQPEAPMDKRSPEYQAAKGFEVHFMQQMMRNMRKTVPENPDLANSRGYQVFRGMLDDQYAEIAARTQGIGLAEVIVKQIAEMQGKGRPVVPYKPAVRPLNKSDVIGK